MSKNFIVRAGNVQINSIPTRGMAENTLDMEMKIGTKSAAFNHKVLSKIKSCIDAALTKFPDDQEELGLDDDE